MARRSVCFVVLLGCAWYNWRMEVPTQKRKASPRAAAAGYSIVARVAEKEAWRLRKRAHKPWLSDVRPVDATRIEKARLRGLLYVQLDKSFADNPKVKIPDRQRVLGAAALLLAVGGENEKAADAINLQLQLETRQLPVSPSAESAEKDFDMRFREVCDIAAILHPR